MSSSIAAKLQKIADESLRTKIPQFRPGDSVKVHAKIVEGAKERVQVFEGVVIRCQGRRGSHATFTVRKVSYNIGVERTFPLHSPRIEKIEVTSRGTVRRKRLYYLRNLRGKASKIKGVAVAEGGATDSSGSTQEVVAPVTDIQTAPAAAIGGSSESSTLSSGAES